MRKKIHYTVEYRDQGEDKEIEISIDFISNRVMKEYSDVVLIADEAQRAFNRMSDISTILAGEELTEEKKQELKEEDIKCTEKILEFNENNYFKKRFDVLEKILIDNGHKDNEMLMDVNFWNDCVEPSELLKFMTNAVYKDIDPKKKVRIA